MADITWSDVTALQANLSTVAAGAQTLILAYVNEELSAAAFGGEDSARFTLARCYLAAHLGELTRRNGAQDVRSETIAAGSVTLAYGAGDEEALAQTSWGRQYAELLAASHLRLGLAGR